MTVTIPLESLSRIRLTPENKCGYCTNSTCCTYLTQSIDGPRSMEDFDLLLWQLAHDRMQLFRDDDGWFLLINNRCRFLAADGRCGIYAQRPQICREHSTEGCEFEGMAPSDFDLFFDGYEALDRYCRKRYKNWDKRNVVKAP